MLSANTAIAVKRYQTVTVDIILLNWLRYST